MPEPTIEADIREHHRLSELWRNHWAQVEIELYGKVPDPVFAAYVRKVAIERDTELWENYCAIATELDVQRANLEVRMVEAHEWLQNLQEKAAQS